MTERAEPPGIEFVERELSISRRDVLRLGAGAVTTALIVPAALTGCADDGAESVTTSTTTATRGPGAPLRAPEVRASSGGILDLDLVARPSTVEVRAAKPVATWTYDGVVPGHTWEVRPGDTLKVRLVNDLPAGEGPDGHAHGHDGDHPVDMTRPHAWWNTNLHTHGLHVSPSGNADNVFVVVEPGETFDYEIAIPDDHTGGIFWYHPHVHGAVTQQVRAGMAGALIVRGELDEVPEVAAATEQVMVFQAIELGDDFALEDPIPEPASDEAFFPRDQILYTVNGQTRPEVRMRPGEVQRWRMLNAAEGKYLSVTLADHQFQVLAWDGLTLARPEATDVVMMAGGNRVDLLVAAGEPGTYELVVSPGSSQKPLIPGMPGYDPDADDGSQGPATTVLPSAELEPRSILTLVVEGEPVDMALPSTLPAYDPPILPIARERDFAFTVERGPEAPTDGHDSHEFLSFGVDGRPFDPDREPYRVQLGTAERWVLTNDKDPKLDLHAHSFHIHINPFKVTHVNGEPLDPPQWRDTMVLPGHSGDSITMEMNFDDFTGRAVEHCHVLSHEDLGMMEAFEVVDGPVTEASPPPESTP